MFGAWLDKFEQRYDRIVSAYVFYEFKLDEKIRLLQRLAENNLVSDGYFVIGDISFVTSASQNKMREDVGCKQMANTLHIQRAGYSHVGLHECVHNKGKILKLLGCKFRHKI